MYSKNDSVVIVLVHIYMCKSHNYLLTVAELATAAALCRYPVILKLTSARGSIMFFFPKLLEHLVPTKSVKTEDTQSVAVN